MLFTFADDEPLDIEEEKAFLDDEDIFTGLPNAGQKVELDLDDAPFLAETDDDVFQDRTAAEDSEAADGPQEEEDAPEENSKRLNTWGLVAAALGTVLVTTAVLAFLVLKIPSESSMKSSTSSVPAELLVTLEPFLIPFENGEHVSILQCTFSLPVDNPTLKQEVERKRIVLRNALYFYLSQKELLHLGEHEAADLLKADLTAVVNQNLNLGQVETVLVDEYLVR
ncbi:MAG: flagellar basal body-associated protein FliL [Desulfovibrionales bacterium]